MTGNSTATADERSLLRAAQAGDERAFGQLVQPYRRALTIHGYRMLGSPQDAEDIVQETLLRAWRGLKSYEPRAPFTSWLYRIATSGCLDELERRPRRPQPVQPYPDTPLNAADAPAFDPAARYALREGLELGLLTAIQQLPGPQRAVLILRDVLGWTSPEVADMLETSVAAVNGALHRARQTIEHSLPAAAPAPTEKAERELLHRYVEAFERDDMDALVSLLREDATLRTPPEPSVTGAVQIARFYERVAGGDLTRIRLTPTFCERPARRGDPYFDRRSRTRTARHRRARDRGRADHCDRRIYRPGAAAVRISARPKERTVAVAAETRAHLSPLS